MEAKLTALKSYVKCEISNINQKIKSLHECLKSIKETEKLNKMLPKECFKMSQ